MRCGVGQNSLIHPAVFLVTQYLVPAPGHQEKSRPGPSVRPQRAPPPHRHGGPGGPPGRYTPRGAASRRRTDLPVSVQTHVKCYPMCSNAAEMELSSSQEKTTSTRAGDKYANRTGKVSVAQIGEQVSKQSKLNLRNTVRIVGDFCWREKPCLRL